MAGKGAPKGNTYAKKGAGDTIGLYVKGDRLKKIKKQLSNVSDDQCLDRAKQYALAGIEEGIDNKLKYLVSDWQSLANIAEVLAPELLSNQQWQALKTVLEKRTEECGITEFIRQVGENLRAKIEESENDE